MTALPDIPDKRYFQIGEVSKFCAVERHVLRYWEQEFPELNPTRRSGRRYYTRKDVLLIRKIIALLYEEELTINGARKKLKQEKGGVVKVDALVASQISTAIADLNKVLETLAVD